MTSKCHSPPCLLATTSCQNCWDTPTENCTFRNSSFCGSQNFSWFQHFNLPWLLYFLNKASTGSPIFFLWLLDCSFKIAFFSEQCEQLLSLILVSEIRWQSPLNMSLKRWQKTNFSICFLLKHQLLTLSLVLLKTTSVLTVNNNFDI